MNLELEKYYSKLEAFKLVEIIDSIDIYKTDVVVYCKEILAQLKVKKEELKSYSEIVLKKRFYNYFVEGKYLSNEIIRLDSYFLNETEAKRCFRESKEEYIKYIEGATNNLPSG